MEDPFNTYLVMAATTPNQMKVLNCGNRELTQVLRQPQLQPQQLEMQVLQVEEEEERLENQTSHCTSASPSLTPFSLFLQGGPNLLRSPLPTLTLVSQELK